MSIWVLFVVLLLIGSVIGTFFWECKVSKRGMIVFMILFLIILNIVLFTWILPGVQ